ncbi:MAG: hypothetical protein ACSLE0_01405, partial [Chitinophagaceae bacterium]
NHFPENTVLNKEMQVKIILKELTFEQIFEDTIFPIWDYGKHDSMVQNELHHLLVGLLTIAPYAKIVRTLLKQVKLQMKDPSH